MAINECILGGFFASGVMDTKSVSGLLAGFPMIKNKALILIDLQNDFCLGGSLAVPDADAVIPLANKLQPYFDLVIATKDWHPSTHISFASNHSGHVTGDLITIDEIPQILWPQHCVQNSFGSEFHPELVTNSIDKVFYKGTDEKIDSYSGLYDNKHLRSTGLGEYLRDHQMTDIYIMGLATDYCVKYTTLDAIHFGFHVYVIEDACRGVGLNPGDVDRAIAEMRIAGAKIIRAKDVW